MMIRVTASSRLGKAGFFLILSLISISFWTFLPNQEFLVSALATNELWSTELTRLTGAKILTLSTTPDINGDGHDDVFAVTTTAKDSRLYLLNGVTGAVIRSQALRFAALEALFIGSPSVRIVVAYSDGIRTYGPSLTQLDNFKTPVSPSHLTTFTGNEVIFYYMKGSASYIDSFSLTTGSLNWQKVLSGFFATIAIQDALVLNSNRLLVLYKFSQFGSQYRALVISNGNSEISVVNPFGTNTFNDDLTASFYNSTHFLYSRQTSSGRSIRLSTIKGNAESVSWSVQVWNEKGNNGFAITDVNKDGVNDVLAVIGGNPTVLNGKDGSEMYRIVEIFSSNVTYVAVVDDSDSNGINEVVVRADRLYLISLKASTYTIMLENEAGSNGLSSIEDINGDGYRDIIAGTGTTVTALMGTLPKVMAPTFSLPEGTYSSSQNVALSCATSGATIRYTVDGSVPTSSSTMYVGPIEMSSSITLKARAFMAGMSDSDVASATYTINPKVSAPTISPAGGTYSSLPSVTISCVTSDATIRYTVDGSDPTSSSSMYSGPLSVSSGTVTIKAKAFKAGMTDSDTTSTTYTVIPPPQVATPTFNPLGGTYSSSQSVAISCGTAGATIRYTIDGSEPSPLSSMYSSPIPISGGTITFKAKAFKSDMRDSDTASVTYTINIPAKVATPTFNPPSGTYTSSQSVTLTCFTAGATIRYTIDGPDPSASSIQYTGPFPCTNSTIKARAFKEGMTNSDVASITYTIKEPAPQNSLIVALISYVSIAAIGMAVAGGILYLMERRKTITSFP